MHILIWEVKDSKATQLGSGQAEMGGPLADPYVSVE